MDDLLAVIKFLVFSLGIFALHAFCRLILPCLLACRSTFLVLCLEAGGEVHGAPVNGEEMLESLSF
jgi:hypothetical protein